MDPVTAITTVLTVINTFAKVYPEVVQGLENLKKFGTTLFEEFTGSSISDTDLATLEAGIDDIHTRLQVPIPDDPANAPPAA